MVGVAPRPSAARPSGPACSRLRAQRRRRRCCDSNPLRRALLQETARSCRPRMARTPQTGHPRPSTKAALPVPAAMTMSIAAGRIAIFRDPVRRTCFSSASVMNSQTPARTGKTWLPRKPKLEGPSCCPCSRTLACLTQGKRSSLAKWHHLRPRRKQHCGHHVSHGSLQPRPQALYLTWCHPLRHNLGAVPWCQLRGEPLVYTLCAFQSLRTRELNSSQSGFGRA
mmetsp:Transcript_72430/g.116799  ORF Transcript_72430/g.116799 Transcript_72430/m.116799 type:complete len:225 (-) Transcript_72430:406-1080(-)